jgi:hypothetical protein
MSFSYQNSYAINRGKVRSAGRNRQLNTYKTSAVGLGPFSSTFLIVAIITISAILYLTQITKTTVYGYQVSELSQEHQVLLEKNQELEIEASRLRSIARVESSAVASNLEPEVDITFSTD